MPIGPIRLVVVCAVCLSLLVVVGTGLYLFDLRQRVLADNEQNLSNTSLIVSKQIEHIFTTVATVQKEIIEQAAGAGQFGAEVFERVLARHDFYVKLRDKAAGMPYVGSLTIFNASGKLINFSRQWPTPEIGAVDREFFKAFHSDPNLQFYVGEPVQSRANGIWVLHLARRISGSNGEFLGLTTAAIELQYLQDTFGQIVSGLGDG